MASPNAGPITGRELIRVIQGGNAVYLNRTEFAALIAKQPVSNPRPIGMPTGIFGTEQVDALQDGSYITMTATDIIAFLSGSAPIPETPERFRPTGLSGAEWVPANQAGFDVALSTAETGALVGGTSYNVSGGPLTISTAQPTASLAVNPPGTPVTLSPATIAALAGKATHNGFGQFTKV